jgi:hypothetical protein
MKFKIYFILNLQLLILMRVARSVGIEVHHFYGSSIFVIFSIFIFVYGLYKKGHIIWNVWYPSCFHLISFNWYDLDFSKCGIGTLPPQQITINYEVGFWPWMASLGFRCQFHQCLYAHIFVQNFGVKNCKTVFSVRSFGAKNFIQKFTHIMLMKLASGLMESGNINVEHLWLAKDISLLQHIV